MYKTINCKNDKVIFLGSFCNDTVDEVLWKQIAYYNRQQTYVSVLGKLIRKSLSKNPFLTLNTGLVINNCLHQVTEIKREKTIK